MSSSTNNKDTTIADLSSDEQKLYLSQRLDKFKLTFIVCIMYGIIAIVILLIAFLTPWGNKILVNDMSAFLFTYIIGTTLIIFFLANEIYNFKPTKTENTLGYDAEMCPDYWKVEYVNEPNPSDSSGRKFLKQSANPLHFRYKCVLDNNIFQKQKFGEIDAAKTPSAKKGYNYGVNNRLYVELKDDNKSKTGIVKEDTYTKFKELAADMSGYTYTKDTLNKNSENAVKPETGDFTVNKVPLSCDTVYPLYLSVMDNDNAYKNSSEPRNRFRCAFANACGVPWTEAGCS